MSIPLNLLVDKDVNTYEITCVAIRNAERITKRGDIQTNEAEDKVVSTSLEQVLNDSIEYEQEEEL